MLSLLLLLLACDGGGSADCAKVLCAANEYCAYPAEGETDSASPVGALPVCTAAPAACGATPSCDCLTCSSCSDEDGLVRCYP